LYQPPPISRRLLSPGSSHHNTAALESPALCMLRPIDQRTSDAIHSAKTLASLIAPHPAPRTTAAPRLFVFLRACVLSHQIRICFLSTLLQQIRIYYGYFVLCVSSVPARLPAKASAGRSVDSYQQATTVVQATPFTPRRALGLGR
jgi:hypothetical protein